MRKSITGVPRTVLSRVTAAGLVHQFRRIALPVSMKHDQDLLHQPPCTCMYCSFPVICDSKTSLHVWRSSCAQEALMDTLSL